MELSNITPSESFVSSSVNWGMPDLQRAIQKSATVTNYAECAGWIRAQITSQLGIFPNLVGSMYSDFRADWQLSHTSWDGAGNTVYTVDWIPCPKGMYYKVTEGSNRIIIYFFPMKGES